MKHRKKEVLRFMCRMGSFQSRFFRKLKGFKTLSTRAITKWSSELKRPFSTWWNRSLRIGPKPMFKICWKGILNKSLSSSRSMMLSLPSSNFNALWRQTLIEDRKYKLSQNLWLLCIRAKLSLDPQHSIHIIPAIKFLNLNRFITTSVLTIRKVSSASVSTI